ncbi:hypothetical protein [Actinokineospora terrae]|uniref:Uncharacterized protein n=1 Tax=Actinokineospora terrae TaxID=155974 RepID=A0A1H9X917_9PSEU|nr:hypothetical protein [Actinokineospora terrae]SES42688.1 hypothetical protein SAMN04487818_113173 [Actinokineospora terrae]
MEFVGIEPLGEIGQIDVVLDELGEVDLRNDGAVVGIRFLARARALSVVVDFSIRGRAVSLEFADAEVIRAEPDLPMTVDPIHGHALLVGLRAWTAPGGRRGCTVDTTMMSIDLYPTRVIATVDQGTGVSPGWPSPR